MQSVLISGVAGTGSSLLSRTFAHTGMVMGNITTFWSPAFESYHYEHDIITNHGYQLQREVIRDGHVPGSSTYEKILYILKKYKEESAKNNWAVYGIKTTTWFHEPHKSMLAEIMQEAGWTDTIRVCTLRHPVQRVKRVAGLNYETYAMKDIQASTYEWFRNGGWFDQYHKYLDEGWIVAPYPRIWEDQDVIRRLIAKVGLKWDDDQVPRYDPIHSRSRGMLSPGEEEKFYTHFPEMRDRWNQLLNRALETI